MSPRDLVYVGHMLDMARKAVDKTARLPRGMYDQDENLRLALTHLVQVIGEAARHLSRDFTASHPEISCTEIVGMCHKVVHDYLALSRVERIVFAQDALLAPAADERCQASGVPCQRAA